MKKFFFMALFAAATVACNKIEIEPAQNGEEPDVEVKMITETVTGGKGTFTKATIANSDASFSWTAGDNIAVHVSNGKYVYTSDDGASGASVAAASASFTVAYPDGYSRDAFAVFPSTIVNKEATNYGQEGHTLDVTLPASYTLAQVSGDSGETSPCPMIATNTAGSGWDFYQLCCLLRLTVNDIPATAKRLEIDFDGKKVWGDFSIASTIDPGTSVIAAANDAERDIITITKDGSDATLGASSLVLNIPLPTGTYSNISVVAYDALSGGTPLKYGNLAFSYTATNIKAVRRTITTNTDPISSFTFTFKNQATSDNLENNLRFVRLFSNQNKLHNATSYGPYTVSNTTDMDNPVSANLLFDRNPSDLLAFQVIAADGKVYSGSYDAPAGGFRIGKNYDLTVNVKAYTFTVESGKKVYFSPGDLGLEIINDESVYSFTEPFTTWGHGNTTDYGTAEAAKAAGSRVWFDFQYESGLENGTVYGITNWRIPKRAGSTVASYEWNYIVDSRTMNQGVNRYYKVTIADHQYCLLLPPDETQSSDIGDDLTSGTVTDYVKYLGKGFVLLFNTNRGMKSSKGWFWGDSTSSNAKQGFYWTVYNGSQRYYFTWPDAGPKVDWGANHMKNHIRYVHNVVVE